MKGGPPRHHWRMSPTPTGAQPLGRLRLHGRPALGQAGAWQPLERKAAAALAWLALRGPVERVGLAELLWPTAGGDAARNSLRQLLFRLRRLAEIPLVEAGDPLRLANGWIIEPAEGELLEGWAFDDCPDFNRWLTQARRDESQRRLGEALQAIDADLAGGQAERALQRAERLVSVDPLCEPGLLRQVQALYLAGRLTDARDVAERAIERLRDEFGALPSDALLALQAALNRAAATSPAARMPVAVMRPPRLVGRSHELQQLQAAWDEGRTALLTGEAGLGKSRLLGELVGGLDGAMLLGCRPGDTSVPYGALARWLRGMAAERPRLLAPLPGGLAPVLPELAPEGTQGGREDVTASVATILQRALDEGVHGVALDDLHFADAASLETLAQLIDHRDLSELRWSLARRPAEGAPELQRLCDALLDAGTLVPLRLAPLDRDGVQTLLDDLDLPELDMGDLASELWQASGGNPMFALETIKALLLQPAGGAAQGGGRRRLPRPPSVAALVQRRLRQLSPAALGLARVAALAGPDFNATLAAQVLRQPVLSLADAWEELEAAQVLRDQAFPHDLIHEATLASVPAPVQRHTRHAIGEHLATTGGEPARVAAHFLAADEPGRAAPHFEQAGRRAEAAARYGEARTLMEQAARCHEQAQQPEAAFDTRLALADLLMEAGEFTAADQVLEPLEAGATQADHRIRLGMQRMQVLARRDQTEDAVRLGHALLADPVLQEDGSALRIAQLRWTLAMCLRTRGDGSDALAQLTLAEPLLAASPDATWRCWFHSQHATTLLMTGSLDLALKGQAAATAAAREVGRYRMLAGCLQNGSTISASMGRLVEALDMLDECLSLMSETGGSDTFTQHVRVQRARLLLWLGRYQDALTALEPLAEAAQRLASYNRSRVYCALMELWTHLGQPHRAGAARSALDAVPLDGFERQVASLVKEEVAWIADQPEPADHAEIFDPSRSTSMINSTLARVQRWRRMGEPGDVDTVTDEVRRLQESGLHGLSAAARVLAAYWATRQGRVQDALQHADAASQQLRHVSPAGLFRPGLFLLLARATERHAALRARVLKEGAEWVRNVARYQVPASYRVAFLERNRINRELLALADGAA